jgi:hypothetical protein
MPAEAISVAALTHPLAPLLVWTLATTVALCIAVHARNEPSPIAEAVLRYGWTLMLLLWMDADARRRRQLPCYDFGLLAGFFFPISVPWYCFWSRGWRGIWVLLLLFAMWLFPYVLAIAWWAVLVTGA